jgi:hypothetical protein
MNIQLQNYKFQLKNIESQLDDSINMQNLNQVANMGIQILNVGIQVLYSVMQMHVFDVDYPNLNQQIQNIKKQMLNIEIEINNNMNMKMNQINNMKIKMDQMNNLMLMNNNIQKNLDTKINVNFKTSSGLRWLMAFDTGITISEMLKKFFERIEKPQLFKSKDIAILYNATKLNWDDNTKIEEKFPSSYGIPTLIINDLQNIWGG